MKWIIGLAVSIFIVGSLFLTYVYHRNMGVRLEAQITAQYKQSQNSLSSLSLRVVDQMGVAKEYKTTVQDVVKQSMEGRFGAKGSSAMFQAFKESYPGTLSPELYVKVQNSIESGRKDFENEQKMLISKVQSYELALNYFWSGLWLNIAGYPKIDLNQYKPIISGHADEVYKNGIDTGIKF